MEQFTQIAFLCYWQNSTLVEVISGTIQGSISGQIINAIYVSPLFDITSMSIFVDNNFMIEWSCQVELKTNISRKLPAVTHIL